MTNSPALLGLTSAAANVPILLFSLHAGVLADRLDQRRLLVAVQVAAAVFTGALALLVTLGVVQFWEVVAAALLVGTTTALASPAYQALVSTLVEGPALGNAIALNSAQFNLSRIVGPVAWPGRASPSADWPSRSGPTPSASWSSRWSWPRCRSPARRAIGRLEASMWGNLGRGPALRPLRPGRAGVAPAHRCPGLLNINYLVLMPVFARDVLGVGAPGLGLMTAAVGIGALGGALTVAIARPGGGSGRLVLLGLAVSSAGLILFSLSTWLPLSLLGLAILGACQVAYYATTNTLIQLLVPGGCGAGSCRSTSWRRPGRCRSATSSRASSRSVSERRRPWRPMASTTLCICLVVALRVPSLRSAMARHRSRSRRQARRTHALHSAAP